MLSFFGDMIQSPLKLMEFASGPVKPQTSNNNKIKTQKKRRSVLHTEVSVLTNKT